MAGVVTLVVTFVNRGVKLVDIPVIQVDTLVILVMVTVVDTGMTLLDIAVTPLEIDMVVTLVAFGNIALVVTLVDGVVTLAGIANPSGCSAFGFINFAKIIANVFCDSSSLFPILVTSNVKSLHIFF